MGSFYVEFLAFLVTTALLGGVSGNFVDLPGTTTADGPTVHTDKGRIQGIINGIGDHKVVSFLGVPYAKPPVHALRFKTPQELEPWTETKETKTTPNACPQTKLPLPDFEEFAVNTNTSEDCLYLNVFVPAGMNEKAKLPVMVWLHGGGFTGGSSTLEAYDGRYLAFQSQAIIVTVNYRLGFLGFMRMKDVKGNMGLLDQKAALEWVRANIATFGGDPEKVTLFGQSAGASSVSLHLVSPLSSDLFQKAIMQSGSFLSPWSFVDVETAEKRSKLVAQKVGCVYESDPDMLECLMEKPVELLVDNQVLDARITTMWFVPTIDGVLITKDPKEMLEDVTEKKPILFGSTENEASLSTVFSLEQYFTDQSQNFTKENYISEINKVFYYYPYYDKQELRSKISEILPQYPPSDNFLQNFQTITDALSDLWFICPSYEFASLYASDTSYNYLFTQTSPNLPPSFGATHGLDLVFSFSYIIKYQKLGNVTENNIKLSEQIISFWSNFAKTGNPNPTDSNDNYATWPAYKSDDPKYLTLNEKFLEGREEAVVAERFRGGYCTFWTQLLNPQ